MPDSPPRPQASITDSPWYWVYLFCTAGLIALVLMGPRYAARQSQIERNAQARQQAAQRAAGRPAAAPAAAPAAPAIGLWPLYWLLGLVLSAAWVQLCLRHWRRRPVREARQPD